MLNNEDFDSNVETPKINALKQLKENMDVFLNDPAFRAAIEVYLRNNLEVDVKLEGHDENERRLTTIVKLENKILSRRSSTLVLSTKTTK